MQLLIICLRALLLVMLKSHITILAPPTTKLGCIDGAKAINLGFSTMHNYLLSCTVTQNLKKILNKNTILFKRSHWQEYLNHVFSFLFFSFLFSLPSHFFPLPSLSSHFHFSTLPSEETKEKKRNFREHWAVMKVSLGSSEQRQHELISNGQWSCSKVEIKTCKPNLSGLWRNSKLRDAAQRDW